MILLDSLYINNSGGKVLLDYLVGEFEKSKLNVFYLFDERCENDFKDIPVERKIYLEASLINRLKFYKKNRRSFKKIFCFANIAPPIKIKEAQVFTYFHNVSLLEQPENYSFKEKTIKQLKKYFIKFLSRNTDFFVVQTLSVQNLVLRKLGIEKSKILIHPFYKEANFISNKSKDEHTFVYISNGNTHKNHLTLFKAWEKLAELNKFPMLNVTITTNFTHLIEEINRLNEKGINIRNHGFCNPSDLYNNSKFLIYPSLMESFGLGLIESCQADCFIIASDLPYVHDVVEPTMVFNPYDSNSIVNSIIEVFKNENLKESKLKISNEIDKIIKLLQ